MIWWWRGGKIKKKVYEGLGLFGHKDKTADKEKCFYKSGGWKKVGKKEKDNNGGQRESRREGNWSQVEERWIRETKWEIHMGSSLPRMLFYSQHFLLVALLEIQLHSQRSEAQSWVSLPGIEDIRHHKLWNLWIFLPDIMEKGDEGTWLFSHILPS